MIYKPTKNPEISPLCYFTEDISCAYSRYECYYCRKFFLKKDRHIENCAGVPGVIYDKYEKSNKFPR